jgi:hypothetical protein
MSRLTRIAKGAAGGYMIGNVIPGIGGLAGGIIGGISELFGSDTDPAAEIRALIAQQRDAVMKSIEESGRAAKESVLKQTEGDMAQARQSVARRTIASNVSATPMELPILAKIKKENSQALLNVEANTQAQKANAERSFAGMSINTGVQSAYNPDPTLGDIALEVGTMLQSQKLDQDYIDAMKGATYFNYDNLTTPSNKDTNNPAFYGLGTKGSGKNYYDIGKNSLKKYNYNSFWGNE